MMKLEMEKYLSIRIKKTNEDLTKISQISLEDEVKKQTKQI